MHRSQVACCPSCSYSSILSTRLAGTENVCSMTSSGSRSNESCSVLLYFHSRLWIIRRQWNDANGNLNLPLKTIAFPGAGGSMHGQRHGPNASGSGPSCCGGCVGAFMEHCSKTCRPPQALHQGSLVGLKNLGGYEHMFLHA
jgi:hypothetical protein